ncbi:MAG: hypothetical protein CMH53_03750 [Myxococcales bacterium]|nr:hypothetical protein [Myxococcales bacterium]
MSFRYSTAPWTQHSAALVVLALASVAVEQPWLRDRWTDFVLGQPSWWRFVGAVFVIHGVVFWSMVAAFAWAARRGDRSWIAKYRIQSDEKRRPPAARVRRVVALNQLFWSPVVLFAIWGLLQARGWQRMSELPSALQLWAMMAGLTLCSATYFYTSHRLLHRPWWMKRVHRVHHEFRSTTAVAAEYAHWFEFLVGNFGTMAFGVILLAPSVFTIYVYTLLGTYTFVAHHSGYAIPWISSPVHHDWHHFRSREAFGTFGHLDRWLRTDREFAGLRDGQKVGK